MRRFTHQSTGTRRRRGAMPGSDHAVIGATVTSYPGLTGRPPGAEAAITKGHPGSDANRRFPITPSITGLGAQGQQRLMRGWSRRRVPPPRPAGWMKLLYARAATIPMPAGSQKIPAQRDRRAAARPPEPRPRDALLTWTSDARHRTRHFSAPRCATAAAEGARAGRRRADRIRPQAVATAAPANYRAASAGRRIGCHTSRDRDRVCRTRPERSPNSLCGRRCLRSSDSAHGRRRGGASACSAGLLTGARIRNVAVRPRHVASATTVRARSARRSRHSPSAPRCCTSRRRPVRGAAVADESIVLRVVAAGAPKVTMHRCPRLTSPVGRHWRQGVHEPLTAGRPAIWAGARRGQVLLAAEIFGRRRGLPRPGGAIRRAANAIRSTDRFPSGGQARLRRHDDRDPTPPGDGDVRRDERGNGDELRTVAPLGADRGNAWYAPAPLFRSTVPSPSRGGDLRLYYRRAKTTEALFRGSARNRAARQRTGACESLGAQRGKHNLRQGSPRDFRRNSV